MKINIQKLLLQKQDDYLFNLLNIDNFNKQTSHLRYFYSHIKSNYKKLPGDIFEFGCYRGRSLLAIALLLKKLKSNKIVYAFDTFRGFPNNIYSEQDSFDFFKENREIQFKHEVVKKIRKFNIGIDVNKKNISRSEDFRFNSKKDLLKKIRFLGLKNIKLIEGSFENTLPKFLKKYKNKIFSVNMDCDLYKSYKVVLESIYPKLIKKGYVHLDEYYSLKFPGCKIAVDEFCNHHDIKVKKNKNFRWEFKRYYLEKIIN